MFNEDKKELSTIDNNNINYNNIFNTFSSYENNQTVAIADKSKSPQNNSKNIHKGEEICKNSKNIKELINKQLIKTLNSTSAIRRSYTIFYKSNINRSIIYA